MAVPLARWGWVSHGKCEMWEAAWESKRREEPGGREEAEELRRSVITRGRERGREEEGGKKR